jgi:hypothetical protein
MNFVIRKKIWEKNHMIIKKNKKILQKFKETYQNHLNRKNIILQIATHRNMKQHKILKQVLLLLLVLDLHLKALKINKIFPPKILLI